MTWSTIIIAGIKIIEASIIKCTAEISEKTIGKVVEKFKDK